MRVLKVCAIVASALLVLSASAYADVQLTIAGGRVSLKARDATLRQILAAWAKVGHTQIINGDRVPGGPMTLELDDVTEEQALDVLLHAVSGYVAAPRPVYTANASRFDRIIVMPTAIAAPAVTAVRAGAPTPVFPQMAPPIMQPTPDEDSDEGEPPQPQNGPARTFTRFPQPQVVTPQQLPPGAVAPAQPLMLPQPVPQGTAAPQQMPSYPGAPTGAPAGVAVPGMVVPAPQPNQPGMPVPPQPRRPGGPSDDDGAR